MHMFINITWGSAVAKYATNDQVPNYPKSVESKKIPSSNLGYALWVCVLMVRCPITSVRRVIISIWDIFLSFQYEKYLKRFNMKHKGRGSISIWNVTFMIEAEADESSVSFKSLLDRWSLYTSAFTWRTGFSWLPYSINLSVSGFSFLFHDKAQEHNREICYTGFELSRCVIYQIELTGIFSISSLSCFCFASSWGDGLILFCGFFLATLRYFWSKNTTFGPILEKKNPVGGVPLGRKTSIWPYPL